jgi:tetratricopeptide (TPR) repeat protein
VRLALGDLPGARKAVDAASRFEGESFEAAFMTGRVLEAEGQAAAALEAYQKAVALNGANPRARLQLSALASRMGRIDVAESQMRALLAMNYQPSRTHFALGRLAQMRGANAEAAQHYREALRIEPGLTMAQEGLRSLGER